MKARAYFDELNEYISKIMIGLNVQTHQGKGTIRRFKIESYMFQADVDITNERGTFNTLSNDFEFTDEPPKLK